MKYSFDCNIANCAHIIAVDAPDDNLAVEEIVKAGEIHSAQGHPDFKVDPGYIRGLVRARMKRLAE